MPDYATNLGTGGASLNPLYGSVLGADTNDPILLANTGAPYLYLPGVLGNFASTPDTPELSITSDIEIVLRVAADSWSPGTEQYVLAKYTTTGNARSYAVSITSSGRLAFRNSVDGINAVYRQSDVSAFTNGATYWLKITLDADTGGSANNTMFEYAVDQESEPASWTLLSSTTTTTPATTTTSIYDSDAVLEIGSITAGASSPFAGKVYRAIVRSDPFGTPVTVFDADFTTGITSGSQTEFTESSSNAATVTINRSASGRKAAAVVRGVWMLGTDDFMTILDSPLLDFEANDPFTAVAVVRYWGTIANNSIVGKGTGGVGATMQGYQMFFSGGIPSFRLGDGTTRVGGVSVTPAASGDIAVYSFHRDVASDLVWAERNGTETQLRTTDTTTGTLATSANFYIGGQSATGYSSCELLAVAVFRRTLSDSELATIANYYGAS